MKILSAPFFYFLLIINIVGITSCKKQNKDLPLLTLHKHIIDINRASFKANVLKIGEQEVIERGICWGTTENPTVTSNVSKFNKGAGFFEGTINGLIPATNYFVRAYAKNQNGIAYSNQIKITTEAIPVVGSNACGGIVIYIYQANDLNYVANETHGLVADKADISTGIEWGCEGTIFTTVNNEKIGMGKWNTEHILEVCTDPNTAAVICNNHSINGYDDWFLPSKDELNLLFLNKQIIGGFGDAFYWSSTEYSAILSHMQYITTGIQYHAGKRATGRVRAVRAF